MTTPYTAVAETHISSVFFAGDRAYKLLKPIRTGFLDHSTPARRAVACHRELELNRRLAPDVYLGVSGLTENDLVADYLIVMRRMPADRRLTALLSTDERDTALRQVARSVAVFHAAQPPDLRAASRATREAMHDLWQHNLHEMVGFADRVIDGDALREVDTLSTAYLAGRRPLFEHRIDAGLARDGHGDLLAEDIFCLPDGPRILDCLAFDDDLRVGDVLLDVAFLAMDLERLAGPAVSRSFLAAYQEFSNEHHPRTLVAHYIAYRALVRCKVACLRADQGSEEGADDARRHLAMVLDHLRAARPRLVLVGGAPGTGKTTTANGIADACGFALLSTDELRKDMVGIGHETHAFAAPGEGIYDAAMTERVYGELIRQAAELLSMGESVVLDASWTTAESRADARRAAAACHAGVVELRCELDAETSRERVLRRLSSERTASDATPAIADHLAARAQPWPEATGLDTSRPVELVVDEAQVLIGPT